MTVRFETQHDSELQHNAQFSPEENKATYKYFIRPGTPTGLTAASASTPAGDPCLLGNPALSNLDMQDMITQVQGTTYVQNRNRTLCNPMSRDLPLAHPIWPWLTSSKILSVQGKGGNQNNQTLTASPSVESVRPITPAYSQPDTYEVTVEFEKKPYALMTDSQIRFRYRFDPDLIFSNSWYAPTTNYVQRTDPAVQFIPNSGYDAGYNPIVNGQLINPIRFSYATEWERYTEWSIEPLGDTVSVNNGTMEFKCAPGVLLAPTGAKFPAPVKQFLPDAIVRMKWFGVPLRYVTSPYSVFQAFVGRINQYPFPNFQDAPWTSQGEGPLSQPDHISFNKFKVGLPVFYAGSLLMVNFKVDRYKASRMPVSALDGPFVLYPWLCNIEFIFLWTTRQSYRPPPATGPAPPAISNANFCRTGWNALPWYLTRNFYYSESIVPPASNNPTAPNAKAPSFFSVPFEALFTDPDCTDNLWTSEAAGTNSVFLSNLGPPT